MMAKSLVATTVEDILTTQVVSLSQLLTNQVDIQSYSNYDVKSVKGNP
jgi:hypothetical protein